MTTTFDFPDDSCEPHPRYDVSASMLAYHDRLIAEAQAYAQTHCHNHDVLHEIFAAVPVLDLPRGRSQTAQLAREIWLFVRAQVDSECTDPRKPPESLAEPVEWQIETLAALREKGDLDGADN